MPGVHIGRAPAAAGGLDLHAVSASLAQREINEVLLETGPTLAGAALRAGLIDELVIYVAPHLMGDAARGLFHLPGLAHMRERVGLDVIDIRKVGRDIRFTARVAVAD
jgi:diaminohydroxyphosphoribosylaminopyrimidine deaminase/5-amino-6-(5-phosphoribosylamino)uracil reductase